MSYKALSLPPRHSARPLKAIRIAEAGPAMESIATHLVDQADSATNACLAPITRGSVSQTVQVARGLVPESGPADSGHYRLCHSPRVLNGWPPETIDLDAVFGKV